MTGAWQAPAGCQSNPDGWCNGVFPAASPVRRAAPAWSMMTRTPLQGLQRAAQDLHDAVDMRALRDERRRDDRASPVALRCSPLSNSFFWNACPRLPGRAFGMHVDRRRTCRSRGCRRRRECRAARTDRVEEIRRQRAAALEQAFVLVDVERREPRGACGRMAGVGVAVKELDRAFGAPRP